MAKYLSKEEILGAQDLKYEEIDVPEWGGTVRIRELTGGEGLKIGLSLRGADGEVDESLITDEMVLRIVGLSVVDENGDRVFTDDDVANLGQKKLDPLQRIFKAVLQLSGMSEEEGPAAGGKDSTPTLPSSLN